jgi:hypothetical protein
MKFYTPAPSVEFEIPDDWWLFAGMDEFKLYGGGFFPPNTPDCELVPLDQIEPPRRNATTPLFRKYKMVPVLFAFMSPECALPPVELNPIEGSGRYRYKVHNGFHRYYASAAVGYTQLPVTIHEEFIP